MRTTICIPLYNQKDFVKEAIDSALAQTVPVNIIVVDDGSTDGGKFVLQDYEGKIEVILQVNKGLSSARNTGLMNTDTEFFLPLDADDALLPTAVERMEKVMDEVKEADIVAPSFTTFGITTQDVILQMRPQWDDFKTGNKIGYCSLFKTKDLKAIGGYSPRMTWGYEDLHMTINLLKRGKRIFTIPEPLWRYRIKENSMIHTAQAHHAELMGQIARDHGFVA